MEEKKKAVAKKLFNASTKEWSQVTHEFLYDADKAENDGEAANEGLNAYTDMDMDIEMKMEIPEADMDAGADAEYGGLTASDDDRLPLGDETAGTNADGEADGCSGDDEDIQIEADITDGSIEEPPVAEYEEPHSRVALSDNKSGLGMGWYVVHTYSGYENKVKANIEKAIENRHLEKEILEVRVPLQDVMELKNGKEKSSQKKLFPGYVLLHMDADNNDAWYVVRNTRGVTGFVGPGSKPVPLTEEELAALDFTAAVNTEFAEGDVVNVIAGVWKDTIGTVQKVNDQEHTLTIAVEMFGRETPVEIGFADVKKMWD